MITDHDDRHAQYAQRRGETIRENEKKNINDIVNRRHSIAHVNFRKAIYRSLSLPQVDDESITLPTWHIKFFIKLFFICLLILLIGSLIKLRWPFHHHQ